MLLVLMTGGVAQEWTPLLDKDLSKWEVWMGAPHTSVDIKWADKCTNPNDGKPMGKVDPLKVFSMVKMDDGSEALRVSGQVLGSLMTKKEFSAYRFRCETKWGTARFAPKYGGPRDSGIIYHSHGPDGVFWNAFRQGLEYQVQEGEIGHYYRIHNVVVTTTVGEQSAGKKPLYYPLGVPKEIGTGGTFSFRGNESDEDRKGWNRIEVIVVGDRAVHLLNGSVIGAFQEAKARSGNEFVPLEKGQIQIQSAGAEVFYRNIEIQNISVMPEKYRRLFTN